MMCEFGSEKCLFLVLVVSRKVFMEVVRFVYSVDICGLMNCIVLKIVMLVEIELLGELMYREMFLFGFLFFRNSSWVMIRLVIVLLIGLIRKMMCFFSRCE